MKVLKDGNRSAVVVCTGKNYYGRGSGGCGATLQITGDDLLIVTEGGRPGDPPRSRRSAFKCPQCGVVTQVPMMQELDFKVAGWDIDTKKRDLTY